MALARWLNFVSCLNLVADQVFAGVAKRFGISEASLRRCMFEQTGGMFPELVTRSDMNVFLPPIGGQTVYVFGPVEYCRDTSKKCTVRVHDECNGYVLLLFV